ncbi:MAG: hypothetical protein H5U40_06305, partial [Polyangiaceae bacterium]|nr:hypothetical protein [Polyangiaceae bacterium]
PLELSSSGVVLVVSSGRTSRGVLAYLAAHIDRERLRRVGLVPSSAVARELPPPSLGRGRRPRTVELEVSPDDVLAGAVARELAAQLDALGASLSIVPPGANADALRIVTVVPPLPGAAAVLSAAFVAAGQRERALALGLDEARARAAAPRLAAVVLGTRREALFHRRGLSGLARDAYGLPKLEELHVRRRSDASAAAEGASR